MPESMIEPTTLAIENIGRDHIQVLPCEPELSAVSSIEPTPSDGDAPFGTCDLVSPFEEYGDCPPPPHPVLDDVYSRFVAFRTEVERLHGRLAPLEKSLNDHLGQSYQFFGDPPPQTPTEVEANRVGVEGIFVSLQKLFSEAVSPLIENSTINRPSIEKLSQRIAHPLADYAQSLGYVAEKMERDTLRRKDKEREQAFREARASQLIAEAERIRGGGNLL